MREVVLRSEYRPTTCEDALLVSRGGAGATVAVGCRRGLLWLIDEVLRLVRGADAELCLCHVDVTAQHEVVTYSLLGTLKLYRAAAATTAEEDVERTSMAHVARTFVQHHLPANVTATKALRRVRDGVLVLLIANARGISLYQQQREGEPLYGATFYPTDAPVHSLDAAGDAVAAGLATGRVLVWLIVNAATTGPKVPPGLAPDTAAIATNASLPVGAADTDIAAPTAASTKATTPAADTDAEPVNIHDSRFFQLTQHPPLTLTSPDADSATEGSDCSGAGNPPGTPDNTHVSDGPESCSVSQESASASSSSVAAAQHSFRSHSVDSAASALVAAAAPVAAVRSRVMSLLSSVVAGGRDKSPSDPLLPEPLPAPTTQDDVALPADLTAVVAPPQPTLALAPVPFGGWCPQDLAASGPALVAVVTATDGGGEGEAGEEEDGCSCGWLAVAWMDGCLCTGSVAAPRWGFDRCVRLAEPFHRLQFLPDRVDFAGGRPRLCVVAATWAGAVVFADADGVPAVAGDLEPAPAHVLMFDARLFLGQRGGGVGGGAIRTFGAAARTLCLFDECGDCHAVLDVRAQLEAVPPPEILPVTFKRETVEGVRKLLAVARYADTTNLPPQISAVLIRAIDKYEGAKRRVEWKETEQLEVGPCYECTMPTASPCDVLYCSCRRRSVTSSTTSRGAHTLSAADHAQRRPYRLPCTRNIYSSSY